MESQRWPQFGGVRAEPSMTLGLTLRVGVAQIIGNGSPAERGMTLIGCLNSSRTSILLKVCRQDHRLFHLGWAKVGD